MDRLACIDVRHLPLQVALRGQADSEKPLVLVKDDKPTSPIVHLNRAAAAQRLRIGMRYSEALSISADLRAVTVSANQVRDAQREIHELLTQWSPRVEDCPFSPGTFWVGASGLAALYGTEAQWGRGLRQALAHRGFRAAVVMGFTRQGTYVAARSRGRSTLIRSADAEVRMAQGAPLAVFPLALKSRRLLERLGVRTLKALSALSAADLAVRFGPEFLQDLRQLDVLSHVPLQDAEEAAPLVFSARLEAPASDHGRLFPAVEALLAQAVGHLTPQGRLVAEVRLVFVLESGPVITEVFRPAQPTGHLPTVVRLADFRLSRQEFPEPVAEVRVGVADVKAPASTGELFAPAVVRDLRRGAEALALIRAQWGNDAVVRPVLTDHHAPELSYRWEAVDHLMAPVPVGETSETAVRRVLWTGPASANPSGQRVCGPFLLQVAPVEPSPPLDKEFWFLRDRRGEVLWVSRDRLTGQPTLEGWVD